MILLIFLQNKNRGVELLQLVLDTHFHLHAPGVVLSGKFPLLRGVLRAEPARKVPVLPRQTKNQASFFLPLFSVRSLPDTPRSFSA